jgi:hypothetical protein
VHTLRANIYFAFVPGAVQAPELWVRNELLGRLLRQVTVPARNVHPADAKFANLPVGQRVELVDLEDDVGNVGEG